MNTAKYFDLIQEIRAAQADPAGLSDEQLHAMVQACEQISDQWLRSQMTRLLVSTRKGEEVWGHIVLGWVYEVARKKSWWTDELVSLMLEGWPDLFVNSSLGANVAEIHPHGVAQGLLTALKKHQIHPDQIPAIWISRLVASADRSSPVERHVVAEFLAHARPGESRWGLKVLEWIRRLEHMESTWKARMVKILIKGWPNLVASRFCFETLNIDRDQLAQALSLALLKGWLHVSDIPAGLIQFLQHHSRQQIQQLNLQTSVTA